MVFVWQLEERGPQKLPTVDTLSMLAAYESGQAVLDAASQEEAASGLAG